MFCLCVSLCWARRVRALALCLPNFRGPFSPFFLRTKKRKEKKKKKKKTKQNLMCFFVENVVTCTRVPGAPQKPFFLPFSSFFFSPFFFLSFFFLSFFFSLFFLCVCLCVLFFCSSHDHFIVCLNQFCLIFLIFCFFCFFFFFFVHACAPEY